jgi:hypothetical protein
MCREVSEILFLLRLAFWILVICLLLPGPPQENQRLLVSAQKTVADVRGFCGRNPDVCDDARITMTAMLAKLKNGADFLQEWLAQDAARGRDAGRMYQHQPVPPYPPPVPRGADQPIQIVPKWGDSLNSSDKEPPWHGPS